MSLKKRYYGSLAFMMLSDSEGSLVMLNSVEQSTCIIAVKHLFYKVVFSRVG